MTVAAEFDVRHGPVRNRVAETQRDWMQFLESLAREAQAEGAIRADEDPAQLAFEINAFLEVADLLYLLMDDPNILKRTRIAIDSTLERARQTSKDLPGAVASRQH